MDTLERDDAETRITLHVPGIAPVSGTIAEFKAATTAIKGAMAEIGERLHQGDQGGIAAAKLRNFVERIERLESEKADLAADIKDVYAEAKGNGFDTKIMRKVIQLRKLEEPDRKEHDELLDLYRRALEI
jgi:uncharacterized protein (UPF0335 family)